MHFKFISILIFSLCCSQITRATKKSVLATVIAGHLMNDNSTGTLNETHVITTRIEEKLPNGCYKQIIKETSSQNTNKTDETLIWVCPPGTPKETIPELGFNCSKNCNCEENTQNITEKLNNTTSKTIKVDSTNDQQVIDKRTEKPFNHTGHSSDTIEDHIEHSSAVGHETIRSIILYITILPVISQIFMQ